MTAPRLATVQECKDWLASVDAENHELAPGVTLSPCDCTPCLMARTVLALAEALREVADSGVEMDDPRVGYLVVQIDRIVMDGFRTLLALVSSDLLSLPNGVTP